ncbi:MAG: ATP phosphoribosyltransferase regulatory subunit [Turneriella sp.]|nr:ATP phosphoribosyltransferase regulatory subunit [Turneriella sp.]
MSIETQYRKVSSPYGFSMLDVESTAALEKAKDAAQALFKSHGFERIMPAMIDFPETFAEGTHSEMFSVKDNSGERLVLRNDITAQVIKGYVRQIERKAGHDTRKFFYMAPVYKDVRKNYPLPREIHQIGCEVVGHKAADALLGIVEISQQILKEVLGLKPSTAISDVEPHNAFASHLGVEFLDAELRRDAPFFAQLLEEKILLSKKDAEILARNLFYPAPNTQVSKEAQKLPQALYGALQNAYKKTKEALEALKKKSTDAYWQPLAAPRSNYYTGLYFESFVPGFTEPMARGGVYNDLVKRYANIEAEACGFALDLLSF